MGSQPEPNPRPAPAGGRWTRPAVAAALFVGAVLLYARSVPYPFTTFDDPSYITGNDHVRTGLTAANAWWALTTGEAANWHPLTWWSLQLDATLFGGEDPGDYRGTNVVLHGVNAALVFVFLARATGAVGRSAAAAALWAVHPLHAESVVWLPERKDTLSMLFGLLALLAYVGYARRPGVGRYLGVAGLLALGLMAKPMLVTLPCVFLLLDYWPLGRTRWAAPAVPGGSPPPAAPPARLVWEKVPLAGVILASATATVAVQAKGGAVGSFESLGVDNRVANSVVAYAMYLWQTVYPVHLGLYYPITLGRSLTAPGTLAAAAFLAAMTALALLFGRRYPYLPVGWLWFLGTLVPVVGLVQVGAQAHADRYTYVPHVGLFLAAVWGAADLIRWPGVRAGAGAAFVLGAAAQCWVQIGHWRGDEELWTRAVAVTTPDNHMARMNLAFARVRQGRNAEALVDLETAVRAEPNNSFAQAYLGAALSDLGRDDEAIGPLEMSIALHPTPVPKKVLAKTLVRAGRAVDALAVFREVGQTDGLAPAAAVIADARVLLDRQDVPKARAELNRVIAHAPALGEPRYLLGVCDDLDDRPADAARNLREAVRLLPRYAPARVRLAAVLHRLGDLPGAAAEGREAVRLAPGDPHARAALGLALLDAGQPADARAEFAEALRLAPEWPKEAGREVWKALNGPAYPAAAAAWRGVARQACEMTNSEDPVAVSALAACEAAAGRYPAAADLAGRAATAADRLGYAATAEEARRQLARYRAGKPFRDPPGTTQ